jgi:hypothetical protein
VPVDFETKHYDTVFENPNKGYEDNTGY